MFDAERRMMAARRHFEEVARVDISELQETLRSARVDERAYSIGTVENESYCLIAEHGKWSVFYSERGNRNNEIVYPIEAQGCAALLKRLADAGLVKNRPPSEPAATL